MAGPLEQLARQIREHKGSLGNALADTGQSYGLNISPKDYIADLQKNSPQPTVPSDVASRFRHRADFIKAYEKDLGFKLSDPTSWLPSLFERFSGSAERKDYEHQKTIQAKVLKAYPELVGIHKQITNEQNRTKIAQLGTLEEVRKQFGKGIKAPDESMRRPASKDEDKAIVTFISQRKAQLLAQPPYGPNYGPDTATAQAIAEARVLFPQISLPSILASFGKPGMEPIPEEDYKVWIGPDRAAQLTPKKLSQILDQQFRKVRNPQTGELEDSDFTKTLRQAEKYAAANQGAGASLAGFLSHLSRTARAAQPNVDLGQVFEDNAQIISVIAALKGFY